MDRIDYVDVLREMPAKLAQREIQQRIFGSLNELVHAEELTHALNDRPLSGCVVDDFQVVKTALYHECVVTFFFNASVHMEVGEWEEDDQIAGVAQAVIDEAGRVRFRNIILEKAYETVAPDVGGGD